MKPIETRYKGYRFRSRLEARWAVFFEQMGATWSYETEGYMLPRVGPYLPDFVVNECFVEIKPIDVPIERDAWAKCETLAKESHRTVLLIFGDPLEHFIYAWWPECPTLLVHAEIGECRRCGGFALVYLDLSPNSAERWIGHSMWCASKCDGERVASGEHAHTVVAAGECARSARFEHGETP